MKRKTKVIFAIICLLLLVTLPATLIKYFSDGGNFFSILLEVLKVLGLFLLGSLIIFLPFTLIGSLIDKAVKTKKGSAYNSVEFINGIFLIGICLFGSYFIIAGFIELYKENLYAFLFLAVSIAFCGYYYYKKKGN